MQVKKIVWKEGHPNFEYGYIGSIEVFCCGYSIISAPDPKVPYLLTSELPLSSYRGKKVEECKAKAQTLLQKFIECFVEEVK